MESPIPVYDLAIEGGHCLTMDALFTEYEDVLILVREGIIEYIGEKSKGPAVFRAGKTIRSSGKLIIPAFINAHTHLSVSLYRGLGTDMRLHDWLRRVIWPLERQFCNPDSVYLGTCLSLLEMIRSGTGMLADMNFFSAHAAKAIEESGLRGFIGEALFSTPTPSVPDPEDGFSVVEGLIDRYRGHPMIKVYMVLHAPFTCRASHYEQAGNFARERNIKVGSHVAETAYEFDLFQEKFGVTPFGWLDRTGVLGPDFIAIHAIHLTEADKELIRNKRVCVVHNPHSNMMLGSGICPVPDLLNRGILVGLGTDSAASNNSLSMLTELQTAAKLHKMALNDPSVLPAREVVWMATAGNAEIYGMHETTGMLVQDYSADFLIIDTNSPNMQPMFDPYIQIAYSMENSDIITSVVNGKLVMEDRKILTLDEELILKEVNDWMSGASVYDFIRLNDD